MANEEEKKCCGKRSCVTLYEISKNVVLDREVQNNGGHEGFDEGQRSPSQKSEKDWDEGRLRGF